MSLQPKKDAQTVTPEGERVQSLIHGVVTRPAITQTDERGTICEIFNPAWEFSKAPLVYVYQVTLRPHKLKGWVVHYQQDDRLFISQGTLKIVLYDGRESSPTHKRVNEFFMGDHHRGLILIPHGVYHAIQNVGETEALFINLPTRPYNHADPDKLRLPPNTDEIPYRFESTLGW